jgi:hypothetical protein
MGGANCVPDWARRKMITIEKSESRFLAERAIKVSVGTFKIQIRVSLETYAFAA